MIDVTFLQIRSAPGRRDIPGSSGWASPPLFAARAVLAETSANVKVFAFKLAPVKKNGGNSLEYSSASSRVRKISLRFSNRQSLWPVAVR